MWFILLLFFFQNSSISVAIKLEKKIEDEKFNVLLATYLSFSLQITFIAN